MRRYGPGGSSFTMGKIMVLFGAWNIVGMVLYKYVIKKEEEKEPGQWKDATGAQHYLRFMSFGSENVQKITLKGLSSVKKENLSQEDVQKLKGYKTPETADTLLYMMWQKDAERSDFIKWTSLSVLNMI